MRPTRTVKLASFSLLLVALVGATVLSQAEKAPPAERRAAAAKNFSEGNWRDSYDKFRELCLDDANNGPEVAQDLNQAVQCLHQLGRIQEVDDLLESSIKAHGDNWRLLEAAANQYLQLPHQGFMIAGVYERGGHRGGGRAMQSLERDRVRAMQLMTQAMPSANNDDDKRQVSQFYMNLANQLLYNRGFYEAWRLQYATNLDELPDYEEGYPYYRNWTGAPVDEAGNPVFYTTTRTWKDAETDGQCWRWALDQVVENDASRRNEVLTHRAQFCQNQFGVQTMQQYGWRGGRSGGAGEDDSGTYALHTLKENETIARLASGIKRFELPDEFNHVKLYQDVAAGDKGAYNQQSLEQLANIFQNRRQYPKAAEYWRETIAKHGAGGNNYRQQALDQIVKSWGRFETIGTQPSGEEPTFEFTYRNGKKVRFVAHEIKVEQLLDDVKAYLKSDPGEPDWNRINIGNIGYRLVNQGEAKYLGEEVARWDVDLEPRENHWDRRITVTTPTKKPGAYMVTAQIEGGNISKLIVWVADTAIVKKQLDGANLYFVADATGGKAVKDCPLEFFGYRHERLPNGKLQTVTAEFKDTKTDENGTIILDQTKLSPNFTWLVTAKNKGGRFAYYGFAGVWTGQYYDAEYNQIKVFSITDRPVYRPGQKVKFKFWVRRAQYDQEDVSQFAGRTFPLELWSPKGEKIYNASMETDEYGGCDGEWEIPADATLGQYRLQLQAREGNEWFAQGDGMFRIEEYKKPEYEVSVDAPDKPVMLGEKIEAKINAKYYFGSPVVNATVKYKIERSDYSQDWYPVGYWDWYYGHGYWWFAEDYPWYPGWNRWVGCMAPMPWWWGGGYNPPELVAENEVEIGPDGTVAVEIDTAIAKELHGNTDHKYTITAEVRDESRRTIIGSGQVLVAREPFKVFSWVDRGHYRVGDTVHSHFQAQTLDSKPVEGKGSLTLLKITYNKDAQPIETPVRRWDVDTNAVGVAEQQLRASAKGQYRLSYAVEDTAGHKIEGGYIFTIMGDNFDGKDYRFNEIELIPDAKTYANGDTVSLQINTNQPNSTVLLFIRPANGICKPPKIIDMMGKSHVEEIKVSKKDMPNFYVEAVTVSGGKVYQKVKELIVPPEKRIVNVEVLPNEKEYLPGQKAKVKLKLTDVAGNPFVGSTTVTMYDKSLEYISGGSNVGDIREFFWKWRRQHNPQHESNLAQYFGNMTRPNELGMGYVGIYGATLADDLETWDDSKEMLHSEVAQGGDFGGIGGGRGGYAVASRAVAAQANGLALADAAPSAPGAAAPANRQAFAQEKQSAVLGPQTGQGQGAAPGVEPTIRTNFADSAFWKADIRTNKEGIAEFDVDMPENLTAWKVKVWAMGHGTKVGAGESEVVTRKNLIVRLQAPRFFVQNDEVVLSANVHNYLKTDKEVTVTLEMPSEVLAPITRDQLVQKVTIPAGGEKRVDWRVKVIEEGQAVVRMKGVTDEESDAMEMTFPAYVHGMLKQEAWAGTVRPEDKSASVKIRVPSERRREETRLEVRYSPTLAASMVDALPYMLDYPYGCTEQTLNRFLPAVITQKTLLDMGINLEDVKTKRTNLNAQELGDAAERAEQWKRFDRNPVFDKKELDDIVSTGITRLQNMQIGDGGWGWFSGHWEQSWPHTTAVVVHGLQQAQAADVKLPDGMLGRGVEWLQRYQADEVVKIKNHPLDVRPSKPKADDLDALVYMVLADAGQKNPEMMDFLYRDRTDLAVYSKAMFGLALHKQGEAEKTEMLLTNIDQYLQQDEENETAYLKLPQNNYWWYWYGSEVEANAWYLKFLAAAKPKDVRAPRLVKYLLNNRKHSTYWNSTRDTAYCVEAFADYMRASEELQPDMTVEVLLDGKKHKEVKINKDNLFSFDGTFLLTGKDVTDGEHTVEIRRQGKGPVYFNAYLINFTLEDPIEKAGLEVKVERKFYRLKPVEKSIKVSGARGQALDQRVEKYERELLSGKEEIVSGDLIEVELEIESKNDYEYIIFEDMKAAGFEADDVRSGHYSEGGLSAYRELRDNRVSFFVRWLARGKNSISYRLRAEIPGKFSALPAHAYAMYAPELKGNSDEMKLQVVDEK